MAPNKTRFQVVTSTGVLFIFFLFIARPTLGSEGTVSLVSQRTLHYRGSRYSVFEIRPCPFQNGVPGNARLVTEHSNGRQSWLYPQSSIFKRNHNKAEALLKAAFDLALKIYTKHGVFNGDSGPALLEDLKTILNGERTVILVTTFDETAWETAPEIHLMVSVHPDGPSGLPLEQRLLGRGLKEKLPRLSEPEVRYFSDRDFRRLGPLYFRDTGVLRHYQGKTTGRNWLTKGIAEIKTLVTNEKSPEDFLVLIHQLLTQNAKWSKEPTSNFSLPSKPPYESLAILFVEEGDAGVARLMAPWLTPVTRLERLWIEAPSDALASMYVRRMKFDPASDGHRFPDPENKASHVSLLSISPERFNSESWDSVKQRRGGEIINDGYLSITYLKGTEDYEGSQVVFLDPDEIAVRQYLSNFAPSLRAIFPSGGPSCIDSMLHMGNGDMEEGLRQYFSQFAMGD